jgi:hypothetical protein
MSTFRLLGDGYEPHVDEDGGTLVYSLPVDSGFAHSDFLFTIGTEDLNVLLTDSYRRAVLEVVAHTVLQRSMIPSAAGFSQSDFDKVIERTLHSSSADLEAYLDQVDSDCHIVTRYYVQKAMAKRAPTKT